MARRIALFCDDPGRGGCARAARTIAEGLSADRRVILAADAAFPAVAGVERATLPLDERKSPHARCDDRRPSMVLADADAAVFVDAHPCASLIAAKRAAKRLGVPFIVSLQLTPGADVLRAMARGEDTHWIDAAHALRFPSETARADFCAVFPQAEVKSRVIANGARARTAAAPDARARVRQALGIREDDTMVLMLARISEQKGQDLAIDAIARLAPEARDRVFLILAGADDDGLQEALERRAAPLGDRVRFLGHRDDGGELLDAADLALLPSRAEGLPFAAVDALMAGAPLAASRAGGLADLVRDGVAYDLGPPEDEQIIRGVVDAIAFHRRDPTASAARAAKGEAYASTHLTTDAMISAYRAALDALTTPINQNTAPILAPHDRWIFGRTCAAWRWLGSAAFMRTRWGALARCEGEWLDLEVGSPAGALELLFAPIFTTSRGLLSTLAHAPRAPVEVDVSLNGESVDRWRFARAGFVRRALAWPQQETRLRVSLTSEAPLTLMLLALRVRR
ncbi:MAG: glycosyltransferase [Alphaproteobacteria bacterium]|nr:glycosyltransferase [Alphaproteobacteria bacterium]